MFSVWTSGLGDQDQHIAPRFCHHIARLRTRGPFYIIFRGDQQRTAQAVDAARSLLQDKAEKRARETAQFQPLNTPLHPPNLFPLPPEHQAAQDPDKNASSLDNPAPPPPPPAMIFGDWDLPPVGATGAGRFNIVQPRVSRNRGVNRPTMTMEPLPLVINPGLFVPGLDEPTPIPSDATVEVVKVGEIEVVIDMADVDAFGESTVPDEEALVGAVETRQEIVLETKDAAGAVLQVETVEKIETVEMLADGEVVLQEETVDVVATKTADGGMEVVVTDVVDQVDAEGQVIGEEVVKTVEKVDAEGAVLGVEQYIDVM